MHGFCVVQYFDYLSLLKTICFLSFIHYYNEFSYSAQHSGQDQPRLLTVSTFSKVLCRACDTKVQKMAPKNDYVLIGAIYLINILDS